MGKRISDLAALGALSGADLLEVEASGLSKNIAATSILAYIQTALAATEIVGDSLSVGSGTGTISNIGQVSFDNGLITSDGSGLFTAQRIVSDGAAIFSDGSGFLTASRFFGDLTGNATTATSLKTSHTINGLAFDGSADTTGAFTAGSTGAGFTVALSVSTVSGVLPAANGGAGTINGLLKANGSGVVSLATAGTDYSAAIPTRLTANVINATTTFSNLTDLSQTLVAGGKYVGKLIIKCNNSTAAEGIKLDFSGGNATMTSFWAATAQIVGGTDVLGTSISTSLAGVINFTTITGETILETNISIVCNAGGTFIPRIAENSHAAGTLTVELGSWLQLDKSSN